MTARQEDENDILVLGEDDKDVVTYSKSFPIILSRMCRNNCPYCGFSRKDSIVVPYSTIRQAKTARLAGAREAHFVAGERPDKFPHIRANLDLWGFDSYSDYVYTVCELSFLEGLIPVVELGFMSPIEMKKIAEVSALNKIMLDGVDNSLSKTLYKESPGKRWELRIKSLEWAGKIKYPVITGFVLKIGESKSFRETMLKEIKRLHEQYGHIHEVLIQNFMPEPNTPFAKKKPADLGILLDTVETARNILPDDVPITINAETCDNWIDFVKAGVRDLGRITVGNRKLIGNQTILTEEYVAEELDKIGLKLQQRFPLRKAFIQNEMYSKKLGQTFDNYKYKIKKDIQEKIKEAKAQEL